MAIEKQYRKIDKVGIIGAGIGGSSIYKMIRESEKADICFVCDINPETRLMQNAKQNKILTITSIDQIPEELKVDVVFECTGIKEISEKLREIYPAGGRTNIVDSDVGEFLFDIFESQIYGLDDDEDTLSHRHLSFGLRDEVYAVPVLNVVEIVRIQEIVPIPNTPEYIIGVIDLRNQVIMIMDLSKRMIIDEGKEIDAKTNCIIIVQVEEKTFGLLIDEVRDVLDILPAMMSDTKEFNTGGEDRFVKGVGKIDDNIIILLDPEKLLLDDDSKRISDLNKKSKNEEEAES